MVKNGKIVHSTFLITQIAELVAFISLDTVILYSQILISDTFTILKVGKDFHGAIKYAFSVSFLN